MPNKLFGFPPLDFSSGKSDHLGAIRALMPGPLPSPIGYERSSDGTRCPGQSSAPGNALGPASSQDVPDSPDTNGLVDSGVQLPSPTDDKDEIQNLRDSEPLLPLVQQRELFIIYLPSMTNEELEQFWKPIDNSGNMPFFRGGPTVPIEISRRLYDLGVHHPGQLFDPYACAALRLALNTYISFAYHPMGRVAWCVRQRLLQEQFWRDEQRRRDEERLRQEEEEEQWREQQRLRREVEERRRDEHFRRLRREEDLRRQREEDDMEIITAEHEQRMRRPDLLTDRYKRPETEDAREHCMRQYMEMRSKRAIHRCTNVPCFEEACTIDLPASTGCRYADTFHSDPNTNPCIWGWGLMLRKVKQEIDLTVARTADLDDIAEWYRDQRRNHQRFHGPVLVTDPPNAPDRNKCHWVVAPPAQNR
ncbi:hypothetical protein M436DRAFT_63485 [Aureobasidium namibiae CBS 147.97]|uniref:Uncharacterized protein n=1 Tax=Aureobasidium namibiae CBS 147.97 TaxID=1043004 RepID=A0A074WTV9_9PEZI|nr:uncharacterized protein M436DRAFT_63485 [Aureobasidium namibiae CBS 147.97]KEQ73162.1 hypothetical protein M436DRAFT_63485 [Aureobasidium namibiae CBS 147.97]